MTKSIFNLVLRLPNFAFSEVTWENLTTKVDAMDNKPVFISATDGNHGYGLAFAAKLLGCPCIIYMPVASISLVIISHVKDFHNSIMFLIPNVRNCNTVNTNDIGMPFLIGVFCNLGHG